MNSIADRGWSGVVPRLGVGLSLVWTARRPIEMSMLFVVWRNCAGMSTIKVGPASNLKKFSRHVLSCGCAILLACPRVNKPMHFSVWIGACAPDTTMRVGGIRRVTSVTTSCHFVCSSGWSHMSVMSVMLSHWLWVKWNNQGELSLSCCRMVDFPNCCRDLQQLAVVGWCPCE